MGKKGEGRRQKRKEEERKGKERKKVEWMEKRKEAVRETCTTHDKKERIKLFKKDSITTI